MGLHIIHTTHEALISPKITLALAEGLKEGGEVVFIVPSPEQVMTASKELAHDTRLAIGVAVHTLSSYVRERWELFGDGRSLVDPTTRALLVGKVVERAQVDNTLDPLTSGPGTVSLLSRVAQEALPHPLQYAPKPGALTPGEEVALGLVDAYADDLRGLGLVEMGEAMRLLGENAGRPVPMVVCLEGTATPNQLRFYAKRAQSSRLVCAGRTFEGPASEAVRGALSFLADTCRSLGCEVSEVFERPADQLQRSDEVQALLQSLFLGKEGGAVNASGKVSLLLPAGPLAEAEAVTHSVTRLAGEGAQHIAVVCPRPAESWHALVPRLSSRGVAARARITTDPLDTEAGRAFASFCLSVARLADLAPAWPQKPPLNDELFDARVALAQGPIRANDPLVVDVGGLTRLSEASLGDMDWWPPRSLTDFLLSSLSGVEKNRAWALDARWRGNRVLAPADVLRMLRKTSATSNGCAEATQQLVERGSISGAARALARSLIAEGSLAESPNGGLTPGVSHGSSHEEELAVLQAFIAADQTASALGIVGKPADGGGSISLLPYVEAVLAAVSAQTIASRISVCPPNAACEVELLGASEAAHQTPASYDAVLYLGLDTQRSPIPRSDSALNTLMEKLGLATRVSGLAMARERYRACLALSHNALVLERTENDASSSETYPAVMLSETLACYQDPTLLPAERRGEDLLSENLSPRARAARFRAAEPLPPLGRLSEESRRYVTVPNNGSSRRTKDALLLSATQLETYLDCPLKWFVTRRLGLESPDAGFSNLEMGSFAHRVLELAHQELLARAFRAAHPSAIFEETPAELPSFDPRERLGGSRVTEDTLEKATEVLDSAFVLHLAHQYHAGTRRSSQALIPHLPSERFDVQRLRDDLASSLAFEAQLFQGFEPRFFELPFGRAGMQEVAYAGALFNGTIDRVDVDAEGHALVIDYKHKTNLFDEYALFDKKLAEEAEAGGPSRTFELPRHVQTLVYAQALRQLRPELEVVGVVYLGTRRSHDLAGAVAGAYVERVFGDTLPANKVARVAVPGSAAGLVGVRSFDELLDASEALLTEVVQRMKEGRIEAAPRGTDGDARYRYVCNFCPVTECERRRS